MIYNSSLWWWCRVVVAALSVFAIFFICEVCVLLFFILLICPQPLAHPVAASKHQKRSKVHPLDSRLSSNARADEQNNPNGASGAC
jgi:hypothetical protein